MPSVIDRIWFADGAHVVTLFDIGAASDATRGQPVAAPIERHLMGRLLGRAEGPIVSSAEVSGALEAQLGRQVRWSVERHGRIASACQGVLSTGLGSTTHAVPDKLGRVGFWVPYPSCGFILDPRLVTEARERPDGRTLHIYMYSGIAFLIEHLETAT